MDVTFTTVDPGAEQKVLAQRLLDQMVHHPIGLLPNTYRRIISGYHRSMVLVVAEEADKLVGVIAYSPRTADAMFYVLPSHRLRGIAARMIDTLRARPDVKDSVIVGVSGDLGWETFFKKNFIFCLDLLEVHPGEGLPTVPEVGADEWLRLYRKAIAAAKRKFKTQYLLNKRSKQS